MSKLLTYTAFASWLLGAGLKSKSKYGFMGRTQGNSGYSKKAANGAFGKPKWQRDKSTV